MCSADNLTSAFGSLFHMSKISSDTVYFTAGIGMPPPGTQNNVIEQIEIKTQKTTKVISLYEETPKQFL